MKLSTADMDLTQVPAATVHNLALVLAPAITIIVIVAGIMGAIAPIGLHILHYPSLSSFLGSAFFSLSA